MNADERLAEIVTALETVGLTSLVMGGHAVLWALPASPLHLTLVEAVRRQYRTYKQAIDRRDKEALRAAQGPPPQP